MGGGSFVYLDFYMDGQIGSHEENSSLPCVVEGFLGLGSPNSATGDSETKRKAPLKVLDCTTCILDQYTRVILEFRFDFGFLGHLYQSRRNDVSSN